MGNVIWIYYDFWIVIEICETFFGISMFFAFLGFTWYFFLLGFGLGLVWIFGRFGFFGIFFGFLGFLFDFLDSLDFSGIFGSFFDFLEKWTGFLLVMFPSAKSVIDCRHF